MRVMRDRLIRGKGHVPLTRPPNRAEQFAIDEWERDYGKRKRPERVRLPGETYIHWPMGAFSKGYVVFMLGLVVFITIMGLNGGLPEKTPEQRRPWFQRHIEPMLPNDVQADLQERRWQKALASLSAEDRRLIAAGLAVPRPTDDPKHPIELRFVPPHLVEGVRDGSVIMVEPVSPRASSPTR